MRTTLPASFHPRSVDVRRARNKQILIYCPSALEQVGLHLDGETDFVLACAESLTFC